MIKIKKIGISEVKYCDNKIFSYKSYRETFKLQDNLPPFRKIHNIIVNSEVKNEKIINNSVLITIFLEVKIIYTSYKDANLYVFIKNIVKPLKISIPHNIKEELLLKIENNILRPNINIYNINAIIIEEKIIEIGFFLLGDFKSMENEDVIFSASFNNLKNNIFMLKSENNELIQKTFYENENIIFETFEKNLLIVKEENKTNKIYSIDNKNKEVEINLPYNLENIVFAQESIFKSYLIITKENNSGKLYVLDNESLIEITNKINIKTLPIYNFRSNCMLYMCQVNNENYLVYESLVYENNFKYKLENNITIEALEISFYTLSYYGKYIGYVLNENNLIIVKTNENYKEEIYIPLNKHIIKEIQFSKNEKLIILLIERNNCEDLYIYNILDKKFKKVTSNIDGYKICSFYINNIESYIYFCNNSFGNFDLYKISLNDFEIKETLHLDADNIKILATN